MFWIKFINIKLFKLIILVASRYFGYREPPNSTKPYALTSVFWHILAAKFIFVSVFIVRVYLFLKKSFAIFCNFCLQFETYMVANTV